MKYLIIGLVALFVAFCSKEDDITIDENDYLIFGHFYGECRGEECVEIFKIKGDVLYEDTTDSYVATEFEFVPLSQEKFELVDNIPAIIPGRLLDEAKNTIGCPDCVDQGGLYIEVSDNGEVKSWRIDQNKEEVPVYLHDFMDHVNEAIGKL